MFDLVVLDTGPLGMVTSKSDRGDAPQARAWLTRLVGDGRRILIPEVADYEVRRELIRARKPSGVIRLDRTGRTLEYLPLSTPVLRLAAELWAEARNAGRPTAGKDSLDIDVIVAAQALHAAGAGQSVVVATSNTGHISRYVRAMNWHEIA